MPKDIHIEAYHSSHADDWDSIVSSSAGGTFLHSRRFLAYHRDRWIDRSIVIRGDGGAIIGILPAAVDSEKPEMIVSHPGATFGGIVMTGRWSPMLALELMRQTIDFYRRQSYQCLHYKVVPHIYHRQPSEIIHWALWKMGANRIRCDLSSTIDLHFNFEISDRRMRSLRKAESSQLQIRSDADALRRFWPLLESALMQRHGVDAVHSLDEMLELKSRFQDEIQIRIAFHANDPVAAVILFCHASVWHVQYSVATESGLKISAMDFLLHTSIQEARSLGIRYFDFGISTTQNGQVLNEGLSQYKLEFGGGGLAYEHFQLKL